MGISNVRVQRTVICDRCGKKFIEAAQNISAATAQAAVGAEVAPVLTLTTTLGKGVSFTDLCPRCRVTLSKLVAAVGQSTPRKPVVAAPAKKVIAKR